MMLFGTVNEAVFDWPWSGIHFASGLGIGVILALTNRRRSWRSSVLLGIGLLILWECFEGSLRYLDAYHHQAVAGLKRSLAGAYFDVESWANIVGDIMIGTVGLAVSLRWLRRA